MYLFASFRIMQVDIVVWRRRSSVILGFIALAIWTASTQAAGPLGPSDRPEAYINGSSYIRLSRPISLKQLVGLSFRTCVGGELFSQRFEQYTLHVTALYERVVVQWAWPTQPRREAGLPRETLDNRWHWVALRYRAAPQALLLEVDRDSVVISNSTLNPELLAPGGLEASGAVLLVGNFFSGCIHEGPQLEFYSSHVQIKGNVTFGHCPLTTDECKDRKDVLRESPIDHCYIEPCMRHGTCISRHDRYECHCTARYSGNNCEVDAGDPCASAPCQNSGRCVEDASGDYSCLCPPHYHGTFCELEVSEDPQCVAGPCRHNGSCSVPPGSDIYVCDCPPGYTGRNCETDVDECLGSAAACLNGGHCVDAVNNYTCDCSGTGYSGARCEVNVNECEEEHGVCGPGVCYDTYGGFVCVCPPPYTGERCHRLTPCASNPCGPGGTCVEEAGGWRCVCARGWAPPLCAAPLSTAATGGSDPASCADLVCPPHSHCWDNNNGIPNMVTGVVISKQVVCVCDIGYYGAPGLFPNCSTLEAACEAGVCLNGGACVRGADHVNCTCTPGYKGAYCETASAAGATNGAGATAAAGKALSELKAVERCAQAPCRNYKACLDTPNGFRCECEAGWGGARCDVVAGGGAGGAADACGCLNGGVCGEEGCECRPGFAGTLCELRVDCRATPCPPLQECTEQGSKWRCLDVGCAAEPCHNGTCLPLDAKLFKCQCPPGVTGKYCDVDIDECQKPKICNHGVCVNLPGSYQCYCKPGYTGDFCDQDIDECLSSPCKNGGTCQNLQNNYECTCMEGFEGKDCSINIDECSSAPCAVGSTCVDGVGTFTCVCQEGLTGPTCEVNIDDCESQPCKNGGVCTDGVNSYTCSCAGTGYAGPDCSINIDECASQPCRHGGSCQDDLNDYHCTCFPGYTGKNCEIDINECEGEVCQFGGVCLQRSDVALYRPAGAPPLQVGPQPHMLLPQLFYQPFSPDKAQGFVCVCVLGTTGARCEENINECASSPCAHGKCVDGVGSYTCDCFAGYEGDHCQFDIDECLRYTPCAHGRCFDGQASYWCECEAGYGGRNCSVELAGCREQPCHNGGTCLPWLQDETRHRFNCSCAPGYHGTTCEKITTMSLERGSFVEVNTTREEGYEISFRFKTTLGNGLLAMGHGFTYFFLELSNGRLNLHSSLLNKWEGVFIGSNLNDSNWQKVFVAINASHLVLAANEEQTIYPISQNEASNSSVTSFPLTRLGTAGSSFATVPTTHGPNFFIGCFQDVVVNRQWVVPEESSETSTEEVGGARSGSVVHGVRAACPRAPQCQPNPCQAGGTCTDAWTSYVCSCPRPHLGDTCQYSYTAATFGHESATPRSAVGVDVFASARRAVLHALDISMFIRTRKPTGYIFYLGTAPKYGSTDETSVGASLKGGELLVHLRFNQTPEDYTVGGTRLDNGHLHLIEVVRNSTLVQVKLNGTEYFRKSISAAKVLDAQVLYLGGPPPPPAPASEVPPSAAPGAPAPLVTTAAPLSTPPLEQHDDADYFKGVIQDVQISNGLNVTVVEFFPLNISGLALPGAFGQVRLPVGGVLRGAVSDDACASRPCLHNATCAVTFNDYQCTCTNGYKGKQCAEMELCQLQGCPLNSHCRNIDGGYECLSNATFDGVNTTLSYELRVPDSAAAERAALPDQLLITYRSKVGGTLFRAEASAAGGAWFSVGVYLGKVSVQWRLPPAIEISRHMYRAHTDADDFTHWTTLKFSFADNLIKGAFVEADGSEEVNMTASIDVAAWQRLVLEGSVQLGGARPGPSASGATLVPLALTGAFDNSTDVFVYDTTEGIGDDFVDNIAGRYFKGCMGPVYIGSMLLPFFTEEELFKSSVSSLMTPRPYYAMLPTGRPWGAAAGVGCVLCLEQDCARGGHCADVRSSYACACPPGYAGDYCEIDIDECENNQCMNNSTCKDEIATYTCICPEGFEGQFCSDDIDECQSGPCLHGGTCVDEVGGFSCSCLGEWRGARCQLPRERSCRHRPCAADRGRCRDAPTDPVTGNNYTCECYPGFSGAHCEDAFCELEPCVHGECRTDNMSARCECRPGWGGRLCTTERDSCADATRAHGAACLHGGRCASQDGQPLCDCTGTGWRGARCEADVDECAEGLVSCLPGDCVNLDGSYKCMCSPGFCGNNCALLDPCVESAAGAEGANSTGPCQNGGACEQRCAAAVDYLCHCAPGWTGTNCTEQGVGLEGVDGGSWRAAVIGASCALVGALALGAALAGLALQARRKRATRGTYSPSGQEYCNPRAEMMHHALKPPPEERLI